MDSMARTPHGICRHYHLTIRRFPASQTAKKYPNCGTGIIFLTSLLFQEGLFAKKGGLARGGRPVSSQLQARVQVSTEQFQEEHESE